MRYLDAMVTEVRHCEERSDVAIQRIAHRTVVSSLDCFADARNDDIRVLMLNHIFQHGTNIDLPCIHGWRE